MASFMRIDPEFDVDSKQLTGVNYRLPSGTDVRQVISLVEQTLADGTSMTVTVEMSDDPRGTAYVVINGRTVRTVLFGSVGEPDS
jgi:hypothetical protein